MGLPKRYKPTISEPELMASWEEEGVYHYNPKASDPVYTIDTPPATVSGKLHMGHVYSYSHADFMARFWRMNGRNVLYPMGYDDNGLPTERLVEQQLNIKATDIGRQKFIEKCLEVSVETEKEYEALWKRLGLSIDWRYTYRTIDDNSRRLSQLSFIDLYEKDLVYRKRSPTIWCPECRTAIAQAELSDLDRSSQYVTLKFILDDGIALPIATTRPELLPACVAVFVHPDDKRYEHLVGRVAEVPFFEQKVPILNDSAADPEKGTGAVMCCTFGDTTDVAWWYTHQLDLVEAINREGRMTEVAGEFSGLSLVSARRAIIEAAEEKDLVISQTPTEQSVRVHERCDTPVEYVVAWQWFIRVLEFKEQLIENATRVKWYPEHMQSRFQQWVENLNWDWCISRQRYYGVTFPVWYCLDCGESLLAHPDQLPIDPANSSPAGNCSCGSSSFSPEKDVMDTWATSSLTPQFIGWWLGQSGFDGQIYRPISMRPQAHEIIRTWAFYSVVKAYHHFGELPWNDAVISGWGLAPEGGGKISKSRGGGPAPPLEMLERYSADAVRYWAASSGLGKDAVISDEKIAAGAKLTTKLWNVARFSSRFFGEGAPTNEPAVLTAADRWLLSRAQTVIRQVTEELVEYDYASAKSIIEIFFWNDLADNYLEMAKQRLYDDTIPGGDGAKYTLYNVILTVLKLFAPYLPYVTEEIYRHLYAGDHGYASIHKSPWPVVDAAYVDEHYEDIGKTLVQIATAVRRYKSSAGLSLGAEISALTIAGGSTRQRNDLRSAQSDIVSITRAVELRIQEQLDPEIPESVAIGDLLIGITP